MDERQKDFQKLKEVLRLIPSGKFTPRDLGKLFDQYSKKHFPENIRTVKKDSYGDLLSPLTEGV